MKIGRQGRPVCRKEAQYKQPGGISAAAIQEIPPGCFYQSEAEADSSVNDSSGYRKNQEKEEIIPAFQGYAFQKSTVLTAEAAEFQRQGHCFTAAEGTEHQRSDDGHVPFKLFDEIAFQGKAPAGLRFGNSPVFCNKIGNEPKACRKHESILVRDFQLADHGSGQILELYGTQEINEEQSHIQHAESSHHSFFGGTAADSLNQPEAERKDQQHKNGFDVFEKLPGNQEDKKLCQAKNEKTDRLLKDNRPDGCAEGKENFCKRYEISHFDSSFNCKKVFSKASISLQ